MVRRRHPARAVDGRRVMLHVHGHTAADAAAPKGEERTVGLAILLLVLALIFGGIGLFVEALQWVLIIALVLLVLGAVTGARGRGSRV